MEGVKKALAVGPGVLISTVITCAVGALLPPPIGGLLFFGGLGYGVALAVGMAEDVTVRVLLGGRGLSEEEAAAVAPAMTMLCTAALGPPLVRVWVRDGNGAVEASGSGRRSVVLSAGLVAAVREGQLPPREAAAVIAHAAGLVRAGLVRSDLLIGFWTLPWRFLLAAVGVVISLFRDLPGTSRAWRLRFVVAGIAVAQTFGRGQSPVSVLIAAIAFLSYAMPIWDRAWAAELVRAGDEEVLARGFGPHLAHFLRRCHARGQARERILYLEGGPIRHPPLGVVTIDR